MRKPTPDEIAKWRYSKLVCQKCNFPKLAKDYYFQNGNPGQPCISCRIKRQVELQKLESKEDQHNYRKDRQKAAIDLVEIAKNHPCLDCKTLFHPICMDFDHLRDKYKNVSQLSLLGFSLKTLRKEIDKCDLVCVRCHRSRTYHREQEASLERIYSSEFHAKRARYYAANKKYLIQSIKMSNPCSWCKGWFDPWQMDFDHIEDKKYSIGTMVYGGRTLTQLFTEISKCRLLCAICHRLVTHLGETHEATIAAFRNFSVSK